MSVEEAMDEGRTWCNWASHWTRYSVIDRLKFRNQQQSFRSSTQTLGESMAVLTRLLEHHFLDTASQLSKFSVTELESISLAT